MKGMKEVRKSRHRQYRWLKYSAATLATTMVVPAAMQLSEDVNLGQDQDVPFNAMANPLKGLQETLQVSTAEAADVTEISSAMELHNELRANPSGDFKLTADIDLSAAGNWQPIESFSGTLDGNGHTISGLTINRETEEYIGLFSLLSNDGLIKDLVLTDVDITGYKYVGALAGSIQGEVENVGVESGTITGHYHYVGGLSGKNGGQVKNVYTGVNVTGKDYTGGVTG
ncbi:ZmpA/ZmpB/ZmpC family metallo-endopeptidase-related protein, partial [Salibacterium aidingense]|uniref:ZmpA/ZmpB/ZmpC family metallo-endopeptidase-related protein n=1 Tax=Salibacterium aidingense TaxID=384933 RepID=UPI002277181D